MIDTALILPSRGLINSHTVEAIWPSEYGYNYCRPYFAHGLTLPTCFNEPIDRALKDSVIEYIAIVEEDIVPPHDWHWTLTYPLRNLSADITFMDYRLDDGSLMTLVEGGKILTGTGCMAMTRAVAERLMPFDNRNRYMNVRGRLVPFSPISEEAALKMYGHHDIDFYNRAHDAGYRVVCVGKAEHWKVREYGRPKVNDGAHTIERLTLD